LLGELMRPSEPARLPVIMRLLHRLYNVRPPGPSRCRQQAKFTVRAEAVELSRQRIREVGNPKRNP